MIYIISFKTILFTAELLCDYFEGVHIISGPTKITIINNYKRLITTYLVECPEDLGLIKCHSVRLSSGETSLKVQHEGSTIALLTRYYFFLYEDEELMKRKSELCLL